MVGLVGLVLAAGESRRMGRAKALLPLGGSTFLARCVALSSSACSRTIVVEGAHQLGEIDGAETIRNENWRSGPMGSLQLGLAHALVLAPELIGVVVLQVDRPAVEAASVASLAAAFERLPTHCWQPRHRGRSGHPIVWPREAIEALVRLDPERATPRDLLARPPWSTRRAWVDVDDLGVLDNVDTPADYEALCARLGLVPWSGA